MKHTIHDTAQMPSIAIIDPNTLAVVGLRAILQDVMPIIEVDTFGSLQNFKQTILTIISITLWL